MHAEDLNPAELAEAENALREEPQLEIDEGSERERQKAELSKLQGQLGEQNQDITSPMSGTSDHRKLKKAAENALLNDRVR